MNESFRQDKIHTVMKKILNLFDAEGLTMIERWYACLCIERCAEAILGEGIKEVVKAIDAENRRD